MTYFFGISISTLIVYMIFRKLNNRYQEQVFKSRMFSLRDELRNLAIDGKVTADCLEFDVIDYSISKTIEESYFITLLYISMLEARYKHSTKKSEDYKREYDELITGIKANKDLYRIILKKDMAIRDYILGQSPLFVFIFKQTYSFTRSLFNIKEIIRKKMLEVNYLPELSGLS